MLPSISNPPMTDEDVRRFYARLKRQMEGDFTPSEREQYKRAKRAYETVLRNNGGKNPILGN